MSQYDEAELDALLARVPEVIKVSNKEKDIWRGILGRAKKNKKSRNTG